ncbi:hypothetical protein L3Q82_003168 [Scortum barcoo]|uniref:Uncharacterized protein n=1 Tax=Scortum barcoo TaxID=214431 RepID=A0ACB8VR58_9TELE|nr:hypothetical protein L3Q82_003168 [Scortum barcoo]
MEHQLQQNNICGVWKGLKTISGFKEPKSQPVGDQGLLLTSHQVRNALKKNRARKAAGPDGISSRLLKSCADQLCGIFGYTFNLSLKLGRVPQLWKTSCIIPVPKTPHPKELNSYRPVALTSHLMKTLERLVLVPSAPADGDDREYRGLIQDFADWCLRNNLQINAGKTKELVVDFRRRSHSPPAPVSIQENGHRHCEVLQEAEVFWSAGTLLRTFYDSVVASAIFYGIVCWASSITDRDRRRMDRLDTLTALGSSFMKHSVKFYFTLSSGVPKIPDYVTVAEVQEVVMAYYDSNMKTPEPRLDWQISGCQWDDETGKVDGYSQYGYNGEDFLTFEPRSKKWIAANPQAEITKQMWDGNEALHARWKNVLTNICPKWLKMILNYGKSFLQRKDLPSVSLLQKSPSSPVSCHATGFYPDRATLIWRKDGEELHEDVDHGEILPNHDGSFQMNVDLKLSSVTPEDWSRYDCVFHLSGVKDDIVTKLDKAEIRTNWEKSSDLTFPIVAAVVVLVLVLIAAAGFTVNKRQKVKHSLKFFFTASSGGPGFQLVGSSEVDGTVAGRCDGVQKLAEVKQGWMQKIFEDDPQHWAHYTRECFERIHGCEWDDETEDVNGINQYGYDGEDLIFLDLKMLTWFTPKPQADAIKLSWDADKSRIKYNEVVLTQICPQWLKKYLTFGKSSLLRTAATLQVSTPDRATLIWRKDGEELHEDVDHGEILPNHDGSFQMSVDLKLSSVTPEDWSRYDCVFHLSGVKDDIVTKLDKAEIRTNFG